MTERVRILILAAGRSSRMGSPKQLLPIRGGVSLLRYVTGNALQVREAAVAVVGTDAPLMREQCVDLPVAWIENREAGQGMSASIRAGVRSAMAEDADAVVMLLGDQPGIEPSVIERVIESWRRTGAPVVQTRYDGQGGHPVLFDRSVFPALMELRGDVGARQLIRERASSLAYVDVPHGPPPDLDTPEEYRQYLRSIGREEV